MNLRPAIILQLLLPVILTFSIITKAEDSRETCESNVSQDEATAKRLLIQAHRSVSSAHDLAWLIADAVRTRSASVNFIAAEVPRSQSFRLLTEVTLMEMAKEQSREFVGRELGVIGEARSFPEKYTPDSPEQIIAAEDFNSRFIRAVFGKADPAVLNAVKNLAKKNRATMVLLDIEHGPGKNIALLSEYNTFAVHRRLLNALSDLVLKWRSEGAYVQFWVRGGLDFPRDGQWQHFAPMSREDNTWEAIPVPLSRPNMIQLGTNANLIIYPIP